MIINYYHTLLLIVSMGSVNVPTDVFAVRQLFLQRDISGDPVFDEYVEQYEW